METDDLMKVVDAAQYLRMHPTDIYRLVNKGELPHIRIGRRIRFRRSDLESFIEANLCTEERPPVGSSEAPDA